MEENNHHHDMSFLNNTTSLSQCLAELEGSLVWSITFFLGSYEIHVLIIVAATRLRKLRSFGQQLQMMKVCKELHKLVLSFMTTLLAAYSAAKWRTPRVTRSPCNMDFWVKEEAPVTTKKDHTSSKITRIKITQWHLRKNTTELIWSFFSPIWIFNVQYMCYLNYLWNILQNQHCYIFCSIHVTSAHRRSFSLWVMCG